MSAHDISDLPLPDGWITETDQRTGRLCYIDTTSNPPRTIPVHPYKDQKYLSKHPAIKEKLDSLEPEHESVPPPLYEDATASSSSNNNKRKLAGILGKLKDKVVGTEEEREAEKQRHLQRDADFHERERTAHAKRDRRIQELGVSGEIPSGISALKKDDALRLYGLP